MQTLAMINTVQTMAMINTLQTIVVISMSMDQMMYNIKRSRHLKKMKGFTFF